MIEWFFSIFDQPVNEPLRKPSTSKTREDTWYSQHDYFQIVNSVTFGDDPPQGYDFYEQIDLDHLERYPKGPFERDFGNGLRRYVWGLKKGNTLYIYAEETPTDAELKKLAQFCPCRVCTGTFLERALACACCNGCLRSENPADRHIKGARLAYQT